MAEDFDDGEWIADGVLAALGDDSATLSQSTQGKCILLCIRSSRAATCHTNIACRQKRTPPRVTT
jgi:hypothetical protein